MAGEIVYSDLEKFVLVYDDEKKVIGKYNLTKLGLEYIDSYEEFEKLYPAPSYNYDCGVLKCK